MTIARVSSNLSSSEDESNGGLSFGKIKSMSLWKSIKREQKPNGRDNFVEVDGN